MFKIIATQIPEENKFQQTFFQAVQAHGSTTILAKIHKWGKHTYNHTQIIIS